MLLPYPLNSHSTDSLGLSHGSHAPVSRILWSRMKSGLNDSINLFIGNFWNPSRTRRIFFQTREPKRQKTFPPELDGGSGNIHPVRDIPILHSFCSQFNNLRPLHQAQRITSSMNPTLKHRLFFRGQGDERRYSAHAHHHNIFYLISKAINGTLH